MTLCFFPPPLRFIKILKIIKVMMPKNDFFFFCKTVKRNGSNTSLGKERKSHGASVASQEALCLTLLAQQSYIVENQDRKQ